MQIGRNRQIPNHNELIQSVRCHGANRKKEFRICPCRFPRFRFHSPSMSHNNDKACHRTNHMRIKEYTDGRMIPCSQGCLLPPRRRHRDSPLTGFIGHKATLHALHENRTESSPENSFRSEGPLKNCAEEIRDII